MTSRHDSGTTPPLSSSRRTFALLAAGGALAGGIWTVGLSALARGRGTHLTVVGDRGWQVILLESGTERVLLLVGEFEVSPSPTIARILTTLRQHVDVVISTVSARSHLALEGRFANALFVLLDAPEEQADTLQVRSLRNRLEISTRGSRLDLERMLRGNWMQGNDDPDDWMVTLSVGKLAVAIAGSLAVLAEHASPETALAIAPAGSPRDISARLPGISIAVNGYGLDRDEATRDDPDSDSWLVRVFPADSARFTFSENHLTLPEWAQPLSGQIDLA